MIWFMAACARTPTTADSGSTLPVPAPSPRALADAPARGVLDGASPAPPVPEPEVPAGFELRTIRHQTIHASLLVPKGATVEQTHDPHGYPRVDLSVAGQLVFLQFDSGVGQLGVTLRKKPPTVYGLPVRMSTYNDGGVAAWFESKLGDVRVLGIAPGVKCSFEGLPSTPKGTLEQIYTVCASLRSPPPGKWRAATVAERAHGGMTDVPEGAWVESERPNTPGSRLRPGRFVARMHVGRFVVDSSGCPASFEALRAAEPPEVEVDLQRRRTSLGDVWIRKATEAYEGDRFPGATVVLALRASRCCRVTFVPWLDQPTDQEIDDAVALCDTYRAH